MPPVFIAFFALFGLTLGAQVPRAFIHGGDQATRSHLGKPEPIEYQAWTSTPWIQAARPEPPGELACRGSLYASTTGRTAVRVRVDGAEQLLDTVTRLDYEVPPGTRRNWRVEFLDPIGGAPLSCQQPSLACYDPLRGTVEKEEGEKCEGGAFGRVTETDHTAGGPRLALLYTRFAFGHSMSGAYRFRLSVRVDGALTEEFWCPRVVVRWPDATESSKESDCAPWDGSQVGERQSWDFEHVVGPGRQAGHVELWHGERKLQEQTFAFTITHGAASGGAEQP